MIFLKGYLIFSIIFCVLGFFATIIDDGWNDFLFKFFGVAMCHSILVLTLFLIGMILAV